MAVLAAARLARILDKAPDAAEFDRLSAELNKAVLK